MTDAQREAWHNRAHELAKFGVPKTDLARDPVWGRFVERDDEAD